MVTKLNHESARSNFIVLSIGLLAALAGALGLWIWSASIATGDLIDILHDYGYVELKPPSNLIQPGTWVVVQTRDPLRLKTVCSEESALHLSADQIEKSTSTDTDISRALASKFNLSLKSLGIGEIEGKSDLIEAVTLRLRNVRLVELADDQIIKNIPKRDKACTEAIKRRYENDPHSLTMIHSALIADAEYQFTFKGNAEATQITEAIERFVSNGNLTINASQKSRIVVVGSNLVWGVKDDSFMAIGGIGLPSVGGTSKGKKSILEEGGPIEDIDRTQETRRSFEEMAIRVSQSVSPLKQPTSMSCWATVYAMLISWKNGHAMSIDEAVSLLGEPYKRYLKEDRGLPGGQELAFVKAAGLRADPPADYELSYFREQLAKKGPIWITTGNGLLSHARLLVGVYSLNNLETRENYEKSTIEFIDPELGSYTYESALEFYGEFEREAAFIVNNHEDLVELRWQIISY